MTASLEYNFIQCGLFVTPTVVDRNAKPTCVPAKQITLILNYHDCLKLMLLKTLEKMILFSRAKNKNEMKMSRSKSFNLKKFVLYIVID